MLTAIGMAGDELVRVFAAVDEVGAAADLEVIQAAVWVVTDDVDAGDLEAIGYGLDEAGLALARQIIEAAGLDPGNFRLFAG